MISLNSEKKLLSLCIVKKIKDMNKYLVVNLKDANDFFLVDDLEKLIREMYSQELYEEWEKHFETVEGWFFENYKVFKGSISEFEHN